MGSVFNRLVSIAVMELVQGLMKERKRIEEVKKVNLKSQGIRRFKMS